MNKNTLNICWKCCNFLRSVVQTSLCTQINIHIIVMIILNCVNNSRRSPNSHYMIRISVFEPCNHCTRIRSTNNHELWCFYLKGWVNILNEFSSIRKSLCCVQILQVFRTPTTFCCVKWLTCSIKSVFKRNKFCSMLYSQSHCWTCQRCWPTCPFSTYIDKNGTTSDSIICIIIDPISLCESSIVWWENCKMIYKVCVIKLSITSSIAFILAKKRISWSWSARYII